MNSSKLTLDKVISNRPNNSKLIGLDLGTKTIGIAFSDTRLQIATARNTLKRTKFTTDANTLLRLAETENVFAIVLGLPFNMDGSEGQRAQSTRAFASNLKKLTDLPIFFQDERLSTHAAQEAMIEADMSRKKRAEKIDAVAAAIILQAALDRLNDQSR
ncbi:MAG: Holliday junction resolvase RuvX [Pseudomonadota bacterium]